ncbi:hypothetical protein [Nocardia suismassiliense]|uniref:hypothetical protein n=1 Tax=Nocardia suismassiliense TaxID=2077092 RepID=UPI00131F15DC|nr:hypothetical protein [Nocardia suismassiliense]
MAVASSSLGAIAMPGELAVRVKAQMVERGLRIGPILSHRHAFRWTFLVNPDIPDDPVIYAQLFRAQISVTRTGTQIALPAPTRRHDGFRRWLRMPMDAYRPCGTEVLDAVADCGVVADRPWFKPAT